MLSLAAKRLIGIAAIVGGVLLIVIGVSKPNPFKETHTYWAEMRTVQGLGAIGRDVRLAGVNVGEIKGVEREGDNARIELVLFEDVPVHEDARVEMRPHTLFEGSSFVDLAPGSPIAELLEEGGTIPLEQTSNYVTLDEALRLLRPEIRESVRDLAEVGAKTLRGEAIEGIQNTLKRLPKLTRNLKGPARDLQGSGREELAGAITGMARTVDAVAEEEDELIPLARRLNRTTAALAVDAAQPLDQALANLPGALRELRDGGPELTRLIDSLDRFAVAATPALPDLTVAVREATPLVEKSIPVLRDAGPLVGDLRTITKRITAAAPTLKDLLVTVNPVIDSFGGSVLPTLLGPSRTGPPVYKQLMATFSAADAVFRPYQTSAQNPSGTGHVWNLGVYLDTGGFLEGLIGGGAAATLSCETVRSISLEAATQMRALGACS